MSTFKHVYYIVVSITFYQKWQQFLPTSLLLWPIRISPNLFVKFLILRAGTSMTLYSQNSEISRYTLGLAGKWERKSQLLNSLIFSIYDSSTVYNLESTYLKT